MPKSRMMQSVLTTPGCSFGSTVRRPRPIIWIMVHLKELGRSSTTQLVGGWSQPSVSTATLTTTWASPEA